MTAAPPLSFVWHGGALHPHGRAKAEAPRYFGEGELMVMAPVEDRSDKTHRHEFAWLREAWRTLPDHLADQFPTSEHLRKRALIDAGFFDETIIDAGTNAAAIRVAAHLRRKDEFALIIVRGVFVFERVAKSQSRRAMDRVEFQASKTALLDTVAAMLEVDPTTLARQERAA